MIDDDVIHWKQVIDSLSKMDERVSLENLVEIESIANRWDEVVTMAEARIRCSTGQLPEISLGEINFEIPVYDLKRHKFMMESAVNLVRAMPPDIGVKPEIELEPFWVQVNWNRVSWCVYAPKIRWPGVNVRVYTQKDDGSPALAARNFRLAQSVIKHTTEFLRKP